MLRLVRAFGGRLIEVGTPLDATWTLGRIGVLLERAGSLPEKHKLAGSRLAATALYSKEEFGSAFRLIEDARRAASFIRERLSPDTWRLIEEAYAGLDGDAAALLEEVDIIDRCEATLRVLAAISGLAQENMNRGAGWHLLDMGRRVERAINACRYARRLACPDGRPDGLAALLDLIDSQITYRSRYLVGLSLPLVRDMVCLDPYNPRSAACQVERLVEHLGKLPKLSDDGMLEEPLRQALGIHRGPDHGSGPPNSTTTPSSASRTDCCRSPTRSAPATSCTGRRRPRRKRRWGWRDLRYQARPRSTSTVPTSPTRTARCGCCRATSRGQIVYASAIDIVPAPMLTIERECFFRNRVTWMTIPGGAPHADGVDQDIGGNPP